jgi:hypothetical protein
MADNEIIAATLLHGRQLSSGKIPAEITVSANPQVLAALGADHPYQQNKPSWAIPPAEQILSTSLRVARSG